MSNVKRGKVSGKTTKKSDAEVGVLDAITSMPADDRVIAERIHAVVRKNAPTLEPKLWYGMPAYFKDTKVVCFFQSKEKFKTRYATLGFQHEAHLDEGNMWPTSYAVKKLGAAEEKKIAELVKKAVS